jgi:hypothetical protein
MTKETAIKLFNDHKIRTHWDQDQEKWYFSIVDVVGVLTESIDVASYWRKLKQRLRDEGNETVTNCHGLKMLAADGKMWLIQSNCFVLFNPYLHPRQNLLNFGWHKLPESG